LDLDPNPQGKFKEAFGASNSAASDNAATKYEDGIEEVEGGLAVGCEATMVDVRKEALPSMLTWCSRRRDHLPQLIWARLNQDERSIFNIQF
jgi:hypothetical protein